MFYIYVYIRCNNVVFPYFSPQHPVPRITPNILLPPTAPLPVPHSDRSVSSASSAPLSPAKKCKKTIQNNVSIINAEIEKKTGNTSEYVQVMFFLLLI